MRQQMRNNSDLDAVIILVREYFEGLHRGDVGQLRKIFDEHARLQAPGVRKSRNEWLDAVGSRPTPEGLGDAVDFRLLALDISGDQALVKLDSPLLGNRYVDYLGMLKEHGEWRIVNKMYADHTHTHSSNNGDYGSETG